MMQRAISVTLFVLCAGVPALAADLAISANGDVEYDDNVFRRDSDKEDDILFRLRPGVRVFEDRGDDLNFSLGYELPVEFSVDNSDELNEVDHSFNGRFDYHVNDRIDIFGNDRYGYLRSTLRDQAVASDELNANQAFPAFTEQRDRVKLNDASLGANYRFSPRLVGRLVGSTDFFDSTRSDRARVYSVGGTADAHYSLTVKHQVGAGGGYTFQDFDDREEVPGSQTNIYRVFGTWRWLIDETLNLEVQAGPSYLETQQDDPSAVRSASAIPFAVLPAAIVTGFFDKTGAALPAGTAVAANSLLIPSFLVQPGGGGSNCATVNGVPVATGCRGNIVLDAISDAALVSSVRDASVLVTHVNPRGVSDHNVNLFADVVLTKRWYPTFASALRYVRQQSAASGLGGTVILDAVSLSNTWDFLERWQLAVRGDWTRRESAFDIERTFDQVTGTNPAGITVPGGVATRNGTAFNSTEDAEIDTDRWGVAARITHQLFRSTSLYAQVRYDQQQSRSDTLGNSSDFENILATFGVSHTFEPIKLW